MVKQSSNNDINNEYLVATVCMVTNSKMWINDAPKITQMPTLKNWLLASELITAEVSNDYKHSPTRSRGARKLNSLQFS